MTTQQRDDAAISSEHSRYVFSPPITCRELLLLLFLFVNSLTSEANMAAIGANMSARNPSRIVTDILQKMGLKTGAFSPTGARGNTLATNVAATAFPRQIAVLSKAGVPATDTAADAPTGVGDLCHDTTNNDVWRCSAYVDTTHFTWGKIVD